MRASGTARSTLAAPPRTLRGGRPHSPWQRKWPGPAGGRHPCWPPHRPLRHCRPGSAAEGHSRCCPDPWGEGAEPSAPASRARSSEQPACLLPTAQVPEASCHLLCSSGSSRPLSPAPRVPLLQGRGELQEAQPHVGLCPWTWPGPDPSAGTYRELHKFSNVAPSSVAVAVLEPWDILPALGPEGSSLCEGGRATVSASQRCPFPPSSPLGGWAGPAPTHEDTEDTEDTAGAPARRSPVTLRPSWPFPGQETKSRPWRTGSSALQTPGPQGLLGATAYEAGVTTDPVWDSCGPFGSTGVKCSWRLVLASTLRLVATAVMSWASRFSSGP